MEKVKNNKHKGLKIFLRILIIVLLIPILVIGIYLIYVLVSYHRIGDKTLEITSSYTYSEVELNKELSLTSYNIGFGAYSPDYTFFLDSGYDKDGNVTTGTYGKGISYEDVLKNTNGSINTLKELNSDFYLIQEVDEDSDRAYHINQKEAILEALNGYDSTYAINFDSAYLFYPFNDPHGKSKAGLETFSKYQINNAERKEYTIATDFSKFFDLDRCFSVHEISVENDKTLFLINSHMSAYDEGGFIRNKQIEELQNFIKTESDNGNYVIVGGDFNHDLLTNNPLYPEYDSTNFAYKDQIDQLKPDWLSYMFDENKTSPFDEDFVVYAANDNPSCRDCDVVWTPGSTFVSTVDGFVVSKNVTVTSISTTKTGENGFEYSDHQPTTLKFILQ